MTENHDEFITKALNAHGIFFKKAVRELLGKMKDVSIMGEEHPVPFLEGAAVDLLADIKALEGHIWLTIECKRAYAPLKKWVFVREPGAHTKFAYQFADRATSPTYLDTANYKFFGDRVCLDGAEVALDKTTEPHKAASVDRIWQAARQVCMGAIGFIHQETVERRKLEKVSALLAPLALPLMVTSAQLVTCEAPSGSVDLLTGNYKGVAATRETDWLVLSHPFTASAGVERDLLAQEATYAFPEQRGFELREGITIVNAAHLEQFIGMLQQFGFGLVQ